MALGLSFKSVSNSFRFVPFTSRGALVVFLSAYGLHSIAVPESDLVILVLAGGLVILFAACLIYALLVSRKLRRKIDVKHYFDDRDALSLKPVHSGLRLTNCQIPPFLSLRLKRQFFAEGVTHTTHILSGSSAEGKRQIIDNMRFPHRGLWKLEQINLELRDAFGLTRHAWMHPVQQTVIVSPVNLSSQPLPILAENSRSGDRLSEFAERTGDLFDIKQYDPSDGASRILWKTFAKSRSLMVRRPEPAQLPEGEVNCFLVADASEDYVAGVVQGFIELLLRENVKVLFAAHNLANLREDPTLNSLVISDPEEIQRAINHSAHVSTENSSESFRLFLETLHSSNRAPSQITCFCSEKASKALLSELSELSSTARMSCALVIVRNDFLASKMSPHSDSPPKVPDLPMSAGGVSVLYAEPAEGYWSEPHSLRSCFSGQQQHSASIRF